jgi:predicted ATPase/DNA-binding SARP family transcriptional activator
MSGAAQVMKEYRLQCLGKLALEASDFSEALPLLLLCYLALSGKNLRSEIAELFWPFQDESELRLKSLSTALGKLRKISLDLIKDEGTKRVRTHVQNDVTHFLQALEQGDDERALGLYGGDFLAGLERNGRLNLGEELREWIVSQRETFKAKASEAMLRLGERLARDERFDKAAELAWRAFKLSTEVTYPLEEDYQRMYTLLMAGGKEREAETTKQSALEVYDELSLSFSQAEARRQLASPLPEVSPFFVGRQKEIETLKTLLASSARLVTLKGMAGVGKTELAKALSRTLRTTFKDGVYFVFLESLPPSSDEASILRAIAQTMGFALETRDPFDSLQSRMGDKKILLVLDNFEPLVHHAGVLARLLETCPKLSLLVTSRVVLNLRFEHVLELSGLGFYSPATVTELAELTEVSESAKLFTVLAQHQSIALTDNDVPTLQKLGELVAGLPLALKLVSGWLPVRTLENIVQEVEHELGVFNQAHEDDPQRHHSVRAAFDVSHALLSKEEQTVFRSLAVFAGDFTPEAAASVASCDLLLLKQLVTKSLLQFNRETERFSFHPLLRQYAKGKLAEYPEEEKELRDKHSRYFLARVRMMTDAKQEVKNQAPKLLSPEAEDIFGAWRWAVEQENVEQIGKTALALMLFADVGTNMMIAESLFERALSLKTFTTSNELRGKLLANLAWCKLRLAKYQQAIEVANQGLDCLQMTQDLLNRGNCLLILGAANDELGNFQEAHIFRLQKVKLYPKNSLNAANAKINLILSALELGHYDEISNHLSTENTFKEHHEKESLVWLAYLKGRFYLEIHDHIKARGILEKALVDAVEQHLSHWVVQINLMLAKVHLEMNELEKANRLCTHTYQCHKQAISGWNEILLLTIQGRISLLQESYSKAQHFLWESLLKTYKLGNVPGMLYRLILFFDLCLKISRLDIAAGLYGFLSQRENAQRTSFVDKVLFNKLANHYQDFIAPHKNLYTVWEQLSLEEVTSIILNEFEEQNRSVVLSR